jgi:hypothetical protein
MEIYPYVRTIHRSVEIQLYVYEKKDVLSFPVMIWGSMILWEVSLYAHFNEQPCDDRGSMILWEVSFEYIHFNKQGYIKNRKVYG